ncbi:MAG: RNA polymerase sigma factor [Oscillospiraceae bacterium]|jgi:RNA polymerase sigma-70 factor (ECF subfamily)|nr:RNA polymerase sigma factor [Oscillospiraceae bacterium]
METEIIDLFLKRSEDALSVATEKFGSYCRKIAENILHSGGDAEECVNETWLKAWNSIPPMKPRSLKAFLGKITRNIALDRWEAAHTQKRGGGVVEIALDELAEFALPEDADGGEITRVINEFLHAEPQENSDIFVKRYWYLQNIKAIAAEYGYGENKVTSLLFRMRGRLKQKLESEDIVI